MTCRQFAAHHLAYLEGTLEAARAERMSGHLRVCTRCLRLHVALRRGLLVARHLPALRASAGFRERLFRRLERRPFCVIVPLRQRTVVAARLA